MQYSQARTLFVKSFAPVGAIDLARNQNTHNSKCISLQRAPFLWVLRGSTMRMIDDKARPSL